MEETTGAAAAEKTPESPANKKQKLDEKEGSEIEATETALIRVPIPGFQICRHL